MRVGVHTSIAGALENAAHHAKKIGCDTFQMFSANPRGWRSLDPTPAECGLFGPRGEAYELSPVAIHDNYLINLASTEPSFGRVPLPPFGAKLERALALGADYLVTHPGSAKGGGPAQAIATCVESLRRAAAGLEAGRPDHPD